MTSYRGGRLYVEGMPAETLAKRFGTPLYAYAPRVARERLRALRGAFKDREPLICYALKANSNRAFCRVLAKDGAGAEVVSGGELQRALAAGFPPRRIVVSGVGKTAAELELAVKTGVLAIHAESAAELALLERASARLRRRAPFSVRLNPGVDAGTHPHIATGRASDKFGVGSREALALYERASRSRWLRVAGIQCHIGSQVFRVGPFARAAAAVARALKALGEKGIAPELIDLGGGLGVGYEGGAGLDLGAFAKALTKAVAPWPRALLVLEPGRYLSADAGVLLTRVLYEKEGGGRRFLVADAGMNDLARPALYGAVHPILPALRRAGAAKPADVVGPVCESGDFLGRRVALPPCRPGDLLAVLKAGAYGFSMSSQYNSRPRAAEVLVEGGRARLARARETVSDLVRHER